MDKSTAIASILLSAIIGPFGGIGLATMIDFFCYRKAVKNRYCKDCLWYIRAKEECIKHAYIENFKYICPHKSPHYTCDNFKYGKFSIYLALFERER